MDMSGEFSTEHLVQPPGVILPSTGPEFMPRRLIERRENLAKQYAAMRAEAATEAPAGEAVPVHIQNTRHARKTSGRPYSSFTPPVPLADWEIEAYRDRPWERRESTCLDEEKN